MAVCKIQNGKLYANGKRVREFGINCSDLFQDWRSGKQGSLNPVAYTPNKSYIAVLDYCVANKIRFVRFLVSAFRTKTYKIGFKDNQFTFLSNLDALVLSAEKRGILLVPSLFFSIAAIPPMFGENLKSYTDVNSKTYDEIASFIKIIVSRYKNSSAIGYWEFGNESEGRNTLTPVAPTYSCDVNMSQPSAWTAEDGWLINDRDGQSTSSLVTERFKNLCLAEDPNGITCSGNIGKIFSVYVNHDYILYTNQQLEADKTHTMSIHTYDYIGFYTAGAIGLGEFLNTIKNIYQSKNKPLIVGEFGYDVNKSVGPFTAPQAFQNQLNQIMLADVDLAMVWEYRATKPDLSYSISDGTAASNVFLNMFNAACLKYNQ